MDDYEEELTTVYYFDKCGNNLDLNKINYMKVDEPYNKDFLSILEEFKAHADEKDELGK